MQVMANKTHSMVAQTIGVKSRKTIENWEKSSSQPKIRQFIMLAKYFGFDASKVIDACMERAMAGDPELDHHSINWSACRL